MKKNITINLFGELYAIDEDAYELLQGYLDSMKRYFRRQEGGAEIADDIEHRVAELLWQRREQGMNAINIDTVRSLIETIGKPQDIGTGSDEATGQAFMGSTESTRKPTTGRKLYRDPERKMLGGVCAGLATYMGDLDLTLVRIITLVCFFLPIPVILLYLVLWIVIPEARTTEDRLRMKGIEVTPETINDELLRSGLYTTEPETTHGTGCLWALIIAIVVPVLLFLFFWSSMFFSLAGTLLRL